MNPNKMALFDDVLEKRIIREKVNSGELHASLIWNDIADLDLHVVCPSGEHMYFGHKESRCGGWLDVDMNASKVSLEPIENIFWASSPSGVYKIYVHNFNNRTDPKTVFIDPKRKVPFRVRLKRNDKIEWFDGEVGPYESQTCFKFNHTGSGALGSYILLPGSSTPKTIKDICVENNVEYKQGDGFYKLIKKENISKLKDLILYNKLNDTFVIGRSECLQILGLQDDNHTLKPLDILGDYDLYIQSTSATRKIPKETPIIMRSSVRNVLKYRRANDYKLPSYDEVVAGTSQGTSQTIPETSQTIAETSQTIPETSQTIPETSQEILETSQEITEVIPEIYQDSDIIIIHNNWEPTNDFISYDLDHTLIKNKSGKTFPTNSEDITLMYPNVLQKINEKNVVIFTNQYGLLKEKGLNIEEWIKRLKFLTNQITKKYIIFAALGNKGYHKIDNIFYGYRKPDIGMYKRFLEMNGGIQCEQYIGDALGRPNDFSDSDIKFAANCGMLIKSPEQFFLESQEQIPDLPEITFKGYKPSPKWKGKNPDFILFVGSPASGKSTFIQKFFPDYKRVNQDTLKTKAKCLKYTEELLKQNQNIIIDNTNPTKEVRAEYINLAKKYGYTPRIFVKEASRDQSDYLDNLRFHQTGVKLSSVVFNVFYGKYSEPTSMEGNIIKIPFQLEPGTKWYF